MYFIDKLRTKFHDQNTFLRVSIMPCTAISRRAHLSFNPLSEERDPAVDSVGPGHSAHVTETDLRSLPGTNISFILTVTIVISTGG